MTAFRRYTIELAAAILAYAVLLFGSVFVERSVHPADPWRTINVLLPMLAVSAIAWVILRQFRRLDELQLRVQLEALAGAVALTAVVTLGWGFLELIGYPKFPTFAVWPLLAIGWMAGAWSGCRRYR